MLIPDGFVQTTLGVHGEAGRDWLQQLPDLLKYCTKRWSLTPGLPFAPLTYNYVLPAVRADGAHVVLKLGVPCVELGSEIDALRIFDGRGCVRLLDADAERGVLLLERLEPGTSLAATVDDDEATAIAAGVMQRLWRPAPLESRFLTAAQWTQVFVRLRSRFAGGTGPLPTRLVEEAEILSQSLRLLSFASAPMLLHGDLHHGNILAAGHHDWRAIDPKGVLGEPAFEPGAFLLNPTPQPASVLARRVALFAEILSVPRERILAWGLVRAVLSACWTLEDNQTGWEGAISVGERLSALNG